MNDRAMANARVSVADVSNWCELNISAVALSLIQGIPAFRRHVRSNTEEETQNVQVHRLPQHRRLYMLPIQPYQ